jgi:aspartate aminotransferase
MSEQKPSISERAAAIKPSATLAVSARAGELRAEGKQVLNFSAGEPDFRPPDAVTEAVRAKLAKNPVGYAPVPGLPELRDLVADKLGAYHHQSWARKNVLISCGGKHSLANLFMVTVGPGEEVAMAAPYWVSYPVMVELAGGTPRIAYTTREQDFKISPDQLASIVGPKTRFFILNSPSNPTGVGYTRAEMRALAEVLADKAPQAWVLCDDIYRELTYEGFEHVSAFDAFEGITDQVIIVDGVSKTYAMTGYRIGFLVAPAHVVKAAQAIQGQMTSGAATPSQWAAIAALGDPASAQAVVEMRKAFAQRRSIILDGLSAIPGVGVVPPDGAFYVFADISQHVGNERFADDLAFATWLLEDKLVATVPGTAFGTPGHLRMSFATDGETIAEGVRRISEAVASLPTAG